jgi:nucleoside-diphosphate-sugar epimerase
MKRVLVTGGGGFVGRACLAALAEQGFEVHATTRGAPLNSASTRWHRLDLAKGADVGSLLSRVQPTHLLHLAWCAKPGSFWTSPENLEWLDRSIRLFQQFAECGGQRIVATGSCAEYDWSSGVCHEAHTPCLPSTLYGRTKLAAATYLEAMNGHGLSTSWARLFFLYGPGASELRMPGAVISALLRGEFANCSGGTQRRDFLHIEDAGRAIVRLLDSDLTGPTNICSGQAVPIREIAIQTAELIGKPELLRLGAVPTAANEPPLIVGDNSRLRDELGWRPRYSMSEGLRQTIASWPRIADLKCA